MATDKKLRVSLSETETSHRVDSPLLLHLSPSAISFFPYKKNKLDPERADLALLKESPHQGIR